jgi:hypothetical protein
MLSQIPIDGKEVTCEELLAGTEKDKAAIKGAAPKKKTEL